jgi:hypothetical protein
MIDYIKENDMERLTRKDKRTKLGVYIPGYPTELNKKIYLKLSNLEDLEEKLGIDIPIIFKAKKEGIYYKNPKHNIYYISKDCLHLQYRSEWYLQVKIHPILDGLLIQLKDYGTKWSLRKEDLEDEKLD